MAPHANFTVEESHGRDLDNEAQAYVQKMVKNIKNAKALCPLDTPEKADQVLPLWSAIYEIIGFTTLDIELESTILKHPKILELMPDIRYVMGECEGALEVTWAERVATAKDAVEAWKIFTTTPLHEFYEYVLKTEWAGLQLAMGGAPESIAIMGSGAMPETCVWVTCWAQKNGTKVRVHSLELLPERLEQSKKVLDALCGSEDCTFEAGDIKEAPQSLREHDAVYFNAAVGATTEEKENILLDIVSRMRPGSFVLTRSTHSIKTMAYPPAQIQTKRVIKKLRPVLTCHLNGESGRSANASFIISRVI